METENGFPIHLSTFAKVTDFTDFGHSMHWAEKYQLGNKLRMYSGWIVFFYACTHLLNHSLGIFSLLALEYGRVLFISFWRLPLLEWLVIASILVHFITVLLKLFTKSTYKGLSSTEWTQIVLGLLIPVILTGHIVETKIANIAFGTEDTYTYYLYWSPGYTIILFLIMISVIWTHGCIGIRSYINQKRWYPKWRSLLAGFAVGLPIFAACGTIVAMRDVKRLAMDPLWGDTLTAQSNPQRVDLYRWIESWGYTYIVSYLLFVLLFFLSRKLVRTLKKKRSGVSIRYLDGTSISVSKGTSLLEASLQANIPHAHVCGGRGRCSTCRVQIIEGHEFLPAPSADESALLERLGCSANIRLACRTRPKTHCTIHPLLLPNVTLQNSLWKKHNSGIDRTVAILFCDLRGFTSMAEEKLPYDVVFVLNQYFQVMGHEIELYHGRIDKFIGDAIMAVFGIYREPQQACLDALAAVRGMRLQLDRLNEQLKSELPEPLQMGFGVHCGHVIIGEMGYKDSQNFVAIGDATNTASRLESLTKDYGCELIISQEAAECADIELNEYETYTVELRGRQKPIQVYAIQHIKTMEITHKKTQVK